MVWCLPLVPGVIDIITALRPVTEGFYFSHPWNAAQQHEVLLVSQPCLTTSTWFFAFRKTLSRGCGSLHSMLNYILFARDDDSPLLPASTHILTTQRHIADWLLAVRGTFCVLDNALWSWLGPSLPWLYIWTHLCVQCLFILCDIAQHAHMHSDRVAHSWDRV